MKVTDVDIMAIRQAIIQILGMPRDDVGCVIILCEEGDTGMRQHLYTLGLTRAGLMLSLAMAAETVSIREPDISTNIKPQEKT